MLLALNCITEMSLTDTVKQAKDYNLSSLYLKTYIFVVKNFIILNLTNVYISSGGYKTDSSHADRLCLCVASFHLCWAGGLLLVQNRSQGPHPGILHI